jgi:hypothetical protein
MIKKYRPRRANQHRSILIRVEQMRNNEQAADQQLSQSMKSALARRSHVLLARGQNLGLLGDLLQPAQHDAVARHKVVHHVLDVGFGAEFLDQRRQLAEVVARDAGEQVVHCLELQAAVDEVQPFRT